MHAIDVGGFFTPFFMKKPEETKDIFEKIPDYKFRADDLMLCTYPKTGTFVNKINDKKYNKAIPLFFKSFHFHKKRTELNCTRYIFPFFHV